MITSFKVLGIIVLSLAMFYLGHIFGSEYAIDAYRNGKVEILSQEFDSITGEGSDEFLISNPKMKDLPEIRIRQGYRFTFPTSEGIELIIPLDTGEFKESNPPPENIPVPNPVEI